MNCDVAYSIGEIEYPSFPYNPPESFPELIMFNSGEEPITSAIYNGVYTSVRRILNGLGLDSENIGTERWNPFSSFVSQGDMVLLKPNWVRDYNVILSSGVDCIRFHPGPRAAGTALN